MKIKQLNIKPIFMKQNGSNYDLVVHKADWNNLKPQIENMIEQNEIEINVSTHDALCAVDGTSFLYWNKPILI
jgi:hypothetical protein